MANFNEPSSPASDSYLPIPGSFASGTHCFDEIALSPASVVRCFGSGDAGDNFKVSRQWAFRKGALVFTLYDWKSTSLYDPDLWNSEELWHSEWPFDLHIGSQEPATEEDVEAFATYLREKTSEA